MENQFSIQIISLIAIFDSKIYNDMYEQFVTESLSEYNQNDNEFSNSYIYHWHSMMDQEEHYRDDHIFSPDKNNQFFTNFMVYALKYW